MANISAIKLPSGNTYNIKDNISGYTTNTGTITKVQTTAGAHTTINVSSGAATFNVPTKTSHLTNDSGFLTSHQDISGKVDKTGDTMTGNLIVPATRVANTFYGITFGRTQGTPVETILYTGIKWGSGWHMPVIHITGYAYGLQSPVEFKIGFYIFADKIGYCGVVNMGSWSPNVYLFKYTSESVDYVAVGLAGSCYYLQLSADVQDEMGKFARIVTDSSAWTWSFLTTAGTIPTPDDGTTCVQVPYKANILNPTKVNGHTVNSDVPANAVFTDTDTKVNMIARGTTKSYLLGTTTAPTSSNQAVSSVAETGVYFDTTAGTLVATTFKGALTGTASGNLTSSSTLSAAKLSGAIPSAVTATTQASTDNSTKIATTAYVTTAIANLPEPMLFKGSVGIDGTVRTLPTAAASNEGWTYKVITALSSPAAEVGDTVISNGSEWVVIPSGDEPSGTVTSIGVSNGGGLSVSGSPITSSGTITVSHADTSSQASSSNSGRTYIQSITLDTYGHVTGLSTATETVTNTDTKLKVAEVTSATQYYPLVGTGTTAAERQYDTTGFKYAGTTGTTRAVGSATLELGNSIASGTTGNKQGQIIMYGANAKKATITLAEPSTDIALALPTSGGTLALASQIPSSTNSATTGITATTTATKTTLGTAFTIPNVTSAGSASSWVFEEKTIPNVTAAGSGSASLTFAMDTTDTKKLKITFSHTHTAPTIGTAIKVQSKKSGANGSAPTLGTAFTVPNVTGNTSATVTIVDGGHTHTI